MRVAFVPMPKAMSDVPVGPGAQIAVVKERLRAARIRKRGVDSDPGSMELAFAKGLEGERHLGALLDEAAACRSLAVIHSLRRADGGDIDHIVVGPAGVTVIDCKSWSGRVSVSKDTLWQGRRNREKHLQRVRDQVDEVRRVLAQQGMSAIAVEGMVCLVQPTSRADAVELCSVPGLQVGGPADVIAHAARYGPLDGSGVRSVRDALVNGFRTDRPLVVPRSWSAPETASVPRRKRKGGISPSPAARSRRGRRSRSWESDVARLIVLAALGLVLAVKGSDGFGEQSAANILTRSQLNDQMGHWRAVAAKRAAGTVRGPRVRSTPAAFQLVFTRAPKCIVRLDVPRQSGRQATMRSQACRR